VIRYLTGEVPPAFTTASTPCGKRMLFQRSQLSRRSLAWLCHDINHRAISCLYPTDLLRRWHHSPYHPRVGVAVVAAALPAHLNIQAAPDILLPAAGLPCAESRLAAGLPLDVEPQPRGPRPRIVLQSESTLMSHSSLHSSQQHSAGGARAAVGRRWNRDAVQIPCDAGHLRQGPLTRIWAGVATCVLNLC
jgi:hypothetical protein